MGASGFPPLAFASLKLVSQVHIFPEGRIKQENLEELRRFKWGISRMLMECEKMPLIIPVWIKGSLRFTLWNVQRDHSHFVRAQALSK